MLTDMEASCAWIGLQAGSEQKGGLHDAQALHHEWRWRQPTREAGETIEDIAISRWTDLTNTFRHDEATTPPDRYFVAIALKAVRVRLTRSRQTIFDGIMPAGSLYVSAPARELRAQFDSPFDFLHLHIPVGYFQSQRPAEGLGTTDELNDLVLLRDSFSEQLARALIRRGNMVDRKFVRCVGQTLAMHVARLELPRTRVPALQKWRLRRVEDYIEANFDHAISLSDLAAAAGLSRMHFAAQFRAATGYSPHEYLLHRRIERAKSLLSNGEMPLVHVALGVGFCTQSHFSTVFKRITGHTPARWRSARRSEAPAQGAMMRKMEAGSLAA